MLNDNSTDEILSSTGSYVPNIILGCIGIGLCAISICETFTFILFILIRCQLTKAKHQVHFLLRFNFLGILIQIFLSILQPLPVLLTGVY
ncbi:unnamed protein product [Adineta steineri]|uniref:Uncharacterized protein n=1 Tax=Adineta steineri TaxID=433720 RepID=A0A819SZB9_9BILA|nr:unnamed protein product [Adineta steineri]